MFGRLVREGSLAVALSVAVAGAPAAAEASWWSDVKEAAYVFHPEHFLGKIMTGSVLWGAGWAGAALVTPPGAVVAGIAIGVAGIALIGWGVYELVDGLSGGSSSGTVPAPGRDGLPGGGTSTGGPGTLPGGGPGTEPTSTPGRPYPNGATGVNVDRNGNTNGSGAGTGRPVFVPSRTGPAGTPR